MWIKFLVSLPIVAVVAVVTFSLAARSAHPLAVFLIGIMVAFGAVLLTLLLFVKPRPRQEF